jgi:hypothetical protein
MAFAVAKAIKNSFSSHLSVRCNRPKIIYDVTRSLNLLHVTVIYHRVPRLCSPDCALALKYYERFESNLMRVASVGYYHFASSCILDLMRESGLSFDGFN